MPLSAIFILLLFGAGAYFIVMALGVEEEDRASIYKVKKIEKKKPLGAEAMNVLGAFNAVWLAKAVSTKERINKRLVRADVKLNANGFVFIKQFAVVMGIVVVIIMGVTGPIAFALPAIGFVLPDMIIGSKIKNREYRILRTFPEIIDLMGLCLSAGLDFMASLRWITEGAFIFDNPFVDELKRLKEELVLGKSKVEALKAMEKRLDIAEVSSLVRTLVIAETMGVSVIDTFERFSGDVRDRRFQRGERQARLSAIKILFPLIFLILPVVGIVIMGPIVLRFMEQDFMSSFGM